MQDRRIGGGEPPRGLQRLLLLPVLLLLLGRNRADEGESNRSDTTPAGVLVSQAPPSGVPPSILCSGLEPEAHESGSGGSSGLLEEISSLGGEPVLNGSFDPHG